MGATIGMKSKVAKQLEAELMSKEKAKVQKTIDAKVKVALKAEAKRLAEKAVARKTKDTVQAMEKGHAHVKSQKKQVKSPMSTGGPSVARAAQNKNHKASAHAAAVAIASDTKKAEIKARVS